MAKTEKTEKIKIAKKPSHDLEINTARSHLLLPEYGRNIQKMVAFCCDIEDREHRNKVAHVIISVMGQLNPHYRDINEYKVDTTEQWENDWIPQEKEYVESVNPKAKADIVIDMDNLV